WSWPGLWPVGLRELAWLALCFRFALSIGHGLLTTPWSILRRAWPRPCPLEPFASPRTGQVQAAPAPSWAFSRRAPRTAGEPPVPAKRFFSAPFLPRKQSWDRRRWPPAREQHPRD